MIHKQKIFKLNMTHSACRVVDIVIGYQDLLGQIVNIFKCRKFSCVRLIICHTVCDLNEIVFITALGKKIDLFSAIVIYLDVIAHIDQFKIDNVFQIVRKIKTIIKTAE